MPATWVDMLLPVHTRMFSRFVGGVLASLLVAGKMDPQHPLTSWGTPILPATHSSGNIPPACWRGVQVYMGTHGSVHSHVHLYDPPSQWKEI